jgi:GrpB-like predicted nucleotidyltransferase (UPF0157 family)
MLGLQHGVNALADYDPRWVSAFDEERPRIAAVLGPLARGIEHYGSTAVPGMRAKPILDILIGVSPIEDWARCQQPLEALGYDYAADAGVPGHFIFGRGRDTTERTHLAHVVAFGSDEWLTALAFRDALRADANLRAEYIAEKTRAVAAAPEGRPRYNELKGPFITALNARLRARSS